LSSGIGCRKPPTDIQRPLAKATSARAITKVGMREETKTTRASAARRSRKSLLSVGQNMMVEAERQDTTYHMMNLKKALADGSKLDSQYAIMEKRREIPNRYGRPTSVLVSMKAVGP
jgi:hypothetical protein